LWLQVELQLLMALVREEQMGLEVLKQLCHFRWLSPNRLPKHSLSPLE
jgi:hypothetical protein